MLTGHRPLIEIGNIKGDNNIYGDGNTALTLGDRQLGDQDALLRSQSEQIRILEEQVSHLKELLSKRDEQMDQVLALLHSKP